MTRRTALDAFVSRARDVTCEAEAVRRGLRLRRVGAELVGPCPVCGGTDRFAINRVKNTFLCRRGGAAGDAIAMVMYLDAVDFLTACSRLTGEPIPDREAQGPDPEVLARREAERIAAAEKREREAEHYRERARAEAYRLWRSGRPAAGTSVEAYLGARKLPFLSMVRWLPDLAYWGEGADGKPTTLHSGPVMLAPVQRPDGRFGAVHITWIDPARPGKKAVIAHPLSGEALPAKKVRGVKKGGAIHLATPADARRLVVGEGIETTASAMAAEKRPDTAYWAAVDLGNLGGRASESLVHPDLTRIDAAGRTRRLRYPGPYPDMADDDAFVPPPAIRELILLGDGDSDRLTTEAALLRGARRAMRLCPGLLAKIAMAPEGQDFNDVLMGAGE